MIASRNVRCSRLLTEEMGTKALNIPYKWKHASIAKCQDTEVYKVKSSQVSNLIYYACWKKKVVIWHMAF